MKVRLNEDVWAFGVIVHRVLTGRLPFPGSTARARADAAARYVTGERPLVVGRDVPNNWHKVVSACLAAEPGARPNASQLLTAVRSAVGESASAGRISSRRGLAVATAVVVLATMLLGADLPRSAGSDDSGESGARAGPSPAAAHYRPDLLRTDTGIPVQYRRLIIEAATQECHNPSVDPPLVAAILKAESNFDETLSDPANDEYGIARWTPRVLRWHLPAGQQGADPKPPFPPEESIPAVGRYLCFLAPTVAEVPGDQRLLLAAAYQSSGSSVREASGVPEQLEGFVGQVQAAYRAYDPG
jgi:serine/threonine protein kinase